MLLKVISKDWGAVLWIEERTTREQDSEGAENTNVAMLQEMYGEWMDRAASTPSSHSTPASLSEQFF